MGKKWATSEAKTSPWYMWYQAKMYTRKKFTSYHNRIIWNKIWVETENAFQFCSSNYLQTHGTAMGTKIAVGFANTLQTHRNFSVHEILLVSPIRCEERLHYRRSAPVSKDLFLSNHLWEKYPKISKIAWQKEATPPLLWESTPLR